MMLAKVYSSSLLGIDAYTVEVDLARGLPRFNIVGLPDVAVKEAKERVTSAIKNSQFDFPLRKITVNLAPADIKKEGKDVTVITWGRMVQRSMKVAQKLTDKDIDVETVDLRTLFPLDKECFLESVKKTGKAIVVHEACMRGGFGGEIVSIIAKEAFDYLDAPIERIAALNVPIPFSPGLERFVLPSEENIENVVLKLLGK